jgi:uncharacterized protein (TIGR03437 family)
VRFIIAVLLLAHAGKAQSIYGRNLIVNGDAEGGTGSTNWSTRVSIPGWTSSAGAPNVVQYGAGLIMTKTTIGPVNRGNNYFGGGTGSATSTLTQKIDFVAAATGIDAGTVTYDASAYLGGAAPDSSQMIVTFLNASGTTLATVKLGAVADSDMAEVECLYWRRQIGQVPAGTRSANIELDLLRRSGTDNTGAADNLYLTVNANTPAQALYGPNLIVNGNAEMPNGETPERGGLDVPGWVRSADFTTERYDYDGDLGPTDPGPPDRGAIYFWGGGSNALSSATQDIDISAAAADIDAGKVAYNFTAWLGGYADQNDNMTVTIEFRNWAGTSYGVITLPAFSASARNSVTQLMKRTGTGGVPAGARYARITLTSRRTDGSDNDGLADSLSLVLTGPVPPGTPNITQAITAGGFGGFASAAPGSWIEIYGSSLATGSRQWAGADFNGNNAPTTLDGTTVTIGGQKAFISYISPAQVNAQVPSNIATGTQQVVVINGTVSSAAYGLPIQLADPGLLAPPVFLIGGKQYAVALHADGTFVLPPGAIAGLTTSQAKPGETILMYGVGFGAVTPAMPAGQIVTVANQLAQTAVILFNGAAAQLSYSGLAPNFIGLYQFNVVVPNASDNDALPLTFTLGGTRGAQTLYTAVKR